MFAALSDGCLPGTKSPMTKKTTKRTPEQAASRSQFHLVMPTSLRDETDRILSLRSDAVYLSKSPVSRARARTWPANEGPTRRARKHERREESRRRHVTPP